MNNVLFATEYISKSDGYGNLAYNLSKHYPVITKKIIGLNSKGVNLSDDKEADIVVKITSPQRFDNLIITGRKKTLGFTMFETDELPKDWAMYCNKLDGIIVPSPDVAEVFKNSGVKVPIYTIPLWVPDKFTFVDRPINDVFTFLFIGQIDNFDRKGFIEIITAFQGEFKGNNNVKLILKTPSYNIDSGKKEEILKDRRIKIINEVYGDDELISLYAKSDCFLFPSHGEGFGLPPAEAMATGIPVIITDWLGPSQFIDEKWCYPIEVRYLEPAAYPPDYGDAGYWATVDVDKVAKLMRHVYENKEEAFNKGKLAADFINKEFRFNNFANKFNSIVNNLLQKTGDKFEMGKSKIVFIAHHISKSEGYGCLGHELAGKYPTVVQDIRDNLDCNELLKISMGDVPIDSYVIQLCAGDLYKNLKRYKKSIGYTMFETTKLSAHWPKVINETCDILIVPSKEVKKVFENCGVSIPIYVVPLWVNDRYRYFNRPKRELFQFLWVGKLDSFNRKGCFDAIGAFKQEFKRERDVRLLIKGSSVSLTPEKITEIFNDDRIILIRDVLDYEGLNKLYKDSDCFIFPTHGEGFGLPPLEAMATGLPTIVTDWLGCREFINKRVCYPIEVDKLEKAAFPAPYGDVGEWAHIDVNKVRKLMRYAYENREEAKKIGYAAAKYVDKNFRFKNFDKNLKIVLGFGGAGYEVSIVLAVKDNVRYLKHCVDSIYNYTKENFELIIIDNASSIEVKDFLEELQRNRENVKVIINKENMGYAYACNQGIKIATGNYLCMLDIDTIVTPGWLTDMLNCMKKNKRCGIVTPSQSYLKDMNYVPFIRNTALSIDEDIVNFSETLKKGDYEEKQIREIYGFCHLVRREVYKDIGVYDWQRYKGVAVNETDLFWRAQIKGWGLFWAKGAYVYHFHGIVKKSLGMDNFAMVEKGNVIFSEKQKHPEDYFVLNNVVV